MTYNTANLIIALIALPADIMMIYYLMKENPLNARAKGTKKILMLLFFSVFLASLFNTFYYLFRLWNLVENHPAANIRSLLTNLALSFIAWVFLIYVSRNEKENKLDAIKLENEKLKKLIKDKKKK